MGKGVIKSDDGEGLYQVEIKFNREYVENRIAKLEKNIEALEEQLATTVKYIDRQVIQLKITSCQKEITKLRTNVPDDYTTAAWCADLTEELTGDVGTIEVPGEVGNIQIQPGFSGGSPYDQGRDGQLTPTMGMPASGAFYNLAMLPGWQKWKPLFRYATINSLDSAGDTAVISIDGTKSSQQNLSINQTATIDDVEINYMNCNAAAFEEGDEVLVKFIGQDWNQPVIIGFKEEPQPCGVYVYIQLQMVTGTAVHDVFCLVWDLETNSYSTGIKKNSGELATFPCLASDISDWKATKTISGQPVFDYESHIPTRFRLPDRISLYNDITWTKTEGRNCNDYNNKCYTGSAEGPIVRTYDGYDRDGETTETLEGAHDIYAMMTNQFGGVKQDYNRVYDYPIDSPDIANFRITSLTNIGGTKGRGGSSEVTEERHWMSCYPGFGWPCDGLVGMYSGRAMETFHQEIEYSIYSPFDPDDKFTREVDKFFDSTWSENDGGGSCSIGETVKFIADEKWGVNGVMDDENMVFTVIRALRSGSYESDCSSMYSDEPFHCEGGTPTEGCDDDPGTVYEDPVPITISVRTLIDPSKNIMNINPFNTQENGPLTAALTQMKDQAESISGPPKYEKSCTNFTLGTSFLK